jgi:hypothetical protein
VETITCYKRTGEHARVRRVVGGLVDRSAKTLWIDLPKTRDEPDHATVRNFDVT